MATETKIKSLSSEPVLGESNRINQEIMWVDSNVRDTYVCPYCRAEMDFDYDEKNLELHVYCPECFHAETWFNAKFYDARDPHPRSFGYQMLLM